jgi:hypothetical protein
VWVMEAASLPPLTSGISEAHPSGLLPPRCGTGGDLVLPGELLLVCRPMDSPSIKGVLPGDDVCAVSAHEEFDAVIEGM